MTFDEARLMANVNARARRLFDDGYRAGWRGTHAVEVRSPRGTAYRLDTLRRACDCAFFAAHQGRHPCKHLLGYRRLLVRQRACRRLIVLLLVRVWADLDDGSSRDRPLGDTTPCAPEAEGPDAQNEEAAHDDI